MRCGPPRKDRLKFVWGIKSYDDLSGRPADLYTINDFEIDYLTDTKKYIYSVETVYAFSDSEHEITYLKGIFEEFTKWMRKKGLQTDYHPSVNDVFGNVNNEGFDDLEELYADFKLKCMGFVKLNSKKK